MSEAFEILETKEATEPTIFQRWLGRSKIYGIEVVMFGFAVALGNRHFFWTSGLANGYDTLWINLFIVGSGFICLSLCMGEMTSALPFSGGIFGFVRAASGPYYGFVVACFEVFVCLTIVAVIVPFATTIPLMTGYIDLTFKSKLIGIFFGLNLFINLLGGSTFWLIVNLSGFLIFFLLFTYMFGTLLDVNKPEVDYETFCKTDKPVEFDALMYEFSSVMAQFQGLQYLPLLSEFTAEPRKNMPRAMVICSTTSLVFSIGISIAACSSLPGQFIIQMVPTPLMFGFQRILKIDFVESVWLNFPAIYAATLTISYSSARQLYMIAKSGFLPSFFTYKTPQTGTPIVTLLVTTAVGLGMAMMLQDYPDYLNPIIRMIDLCTYFVFINAFVAYILFKKKYSSLPRDFRSPLGIWGAYIGIGINLLGVFAEFKYQNEQDMLIAVYVLLVLFGCVTVFYWVYLVRNQSFSEEEKKLMFKAYLINANRDKRLRILRNNRVASVSTAPKSQVQNRSACSDTQSKATDNNVTCPKDDDKHCELAQLPFKDHYLGIRQSETVESQNSQKLQHGKSLSEKIVQYVSEKMNGMSPEALEEYERLAILSSGGILESSEEKALAEETGINDVEQQVVTTNE